MNKSSEWALKDAFSNEDSLCWDGAEPFSIKPDSGRMADTSLSPDNRYSVVGTVIDCRIPVEVRKQMAMGIMPIMSYMEWAKLESGEC